jgi:hypothetical protein
MSLTGSSLCLALLCVFGTVARPASADEVVLESGGVRAVFDRQTAALRSLGSDRHPVPIGAAGGRLLVQDFPAGAIQMLVAESCKLSDQRVKCTYTGPELTCELEWCIEGGMLRTNGRLTNSTGRDRAVVLVYELPAAEERMQFSPSLNSFVPVTDPPPTSSVYPLAAMCGQTAAVALAIPPTSPCMFKLVGGRQSFGLRLYLGLSHDTKAFPDSGNFSLLVYGCDPKWGFRDALRQYYALFPEFYTHHGRGDGLWMFHTSEPPNIEHYRYNETFVGGDLPRTLERDHAAGVLTIPYMIVGQREIKQLPNLPQNYQQAMAAFEHWEPEADITTRPVKGSSASGGGVHLKAEIGDSALKDARGNYVINIRNTPWGGNSVTFVTNPNPHLMDDQSGARATGALAMEQVHQWLAKYPATDGIYIDSLGSAWCGKLDSAREHFPYTRYPLTFDSAGRLAIHNTISHYEFLEPLRNELHAGKRLLFANGIYPYTAKQPEYADVRETGRFFLASLLDVAGSESGVQPSMLRWEFFRTCMGPKPYVLLNYFWTDAAKVETYLNRALCYDVFATNTNLKSTDYATDSAGYARDRKLFDWFVPLARTLSKAGWQPVTHATSSTPDVRLERYGQAPEVFFTLHNHGPTTRECILKIEKAPLSFGAAAEVEQISGPGLAAVEQDDTSIRVRTNLGANRTAVLRAR